MSHAEVLTQSPVSAEECATPALRLGHVTALATILVGTSFFLIWNSMQVLDFFDMSAFMDAGYRVSQGQRPYTDFFYNAGPVHLYLHALFFKLHGFSLAAIQAHLLTVSGIAVLITFYLATRTLPLGVAALCTAVGGFAFYGPISHPWYDQNAYLWVLLGLFIVEFPSDRKGVKALACGLLTGLAFFTKANIGAASSVLFLTPYLFERPKKSGAIQAVIFAAGALLSALLCLGTLAEPMEFFNQTFLAYGVGNRLLDLDKLAWVLEVTPHLTLAGIATLFFVLNPAEDRKETAGDFRMLLALALVSTFAAWTGSMLIPSNIPLWGIESVYLLRIAFTARLYPTQSRVFRVAGTVVVAALFALAVRKSVTRLTWTWHPSNLENDYALQTEAVKGWKCNGRIGQGVDRAVAFIQAHVPVNESLFVFPDATLIYGLTGRTSYPGAPFIFHLNEIPPPGKYLSTFHAQFMKSPPRWVLLHRQLELPMAHVHATLRWLELDTVLKDQYARVWMDGDFQLLKFYGPKKG